MSDKRGVLKFLDLTRLEYDVVADDHRRKGLAPPAEAIHVDGTGQESIQPVSLCDARPMDVGCIRWAGFHRWLRPGKSVEGIAPIPGFPFYDKPKRSKRKTIAAKRRRR